MRKPRFSERQIVSILKEHDAGATVLELGPAARRASERRRRLGHGEQ
jgi:hypothetical protein